mgnify:CR=1 FL=1
MSDSVVKSILKIIFNCHQIPERSFFIAGRQFSLCARCTGILAGLIAFPLFMIFQIKIPITLSIVFIIPLVFDGGVQLIFCITSNNLRRFLTGVLFSLGSLSLARAIIKELFFTY